MMLLPLYVHPLVDPLAWEAAAAAGPGVTVVVNVHNGPGDWHEEAYAQATARLYAAGVPMLGYVDLGYLRRLGGEIWCDMTGWAQYPVAGVFFDQAPSGRDALGEVARIVRAARGPVVLNPGTRPHPGYAAIADMVCTFEGPWGTYVDMPAVADWPNAAHLVYGVPVDRLAEARALLRVRAPHGLVTDLGTPLPYLGVPASMRPGAAVRPAGVL
jgi:hypothetical protein